MFLPDGRIKDRYTGYYTVNPKVPVPFAQLWAPRLKANTQLKGYADEAPSTRGGCNLQLVNSFGYCRPGFQVLNT